MKFYLLLFLTVYSYYCSAQIFPQDGDTLNYRLAGFQFENCKKSPTYLLQIASGSYTDPKQFASNVFYTQKSDSNRQIVRLPRFNEAYTWQVTCLNRKGSKIQTSPLHHFTIGSIPSVDTSLFRLNIHKYDERHPDLLLFVDYLRVMYDMHGEPLWYLPNIPGKVDSSSRVRDLKPTGMGTFTFMTDSGAFEIDYNGNVVWEAPNDGKVSGNDSSEHYHHEFTRLGNGNYMVAGMESFLRRIPNIKDTSLYTNEADIVRKGGEFYKRVIGSTIIEYNTDKKIVWTWRTSNHFSDEDLFTKTFPNGTVNPNTHLNSFYFDEENNVIYIGFRDISRIVKIEYPSGKEIISYGESYVANKPIMGTGFFRGQHNVILNKRGEILLFNNNGGIKGVRPEGRKHTSYVVKLIEPNAANNFKLEKAWSFACDFDTLSRSGSITGGSVYELNDGSIVSGMGNVNRIFIVDTNKNVLMNAFVQTRQSKTSDWQPGGSYRTSIIDNLDTLHTMIFYRAKK